MLDWILKNPQVVFILLFAIVALFGRVAQAQKEAKAKREREMRSGRKAPEQKQTAFDASSMDDAEAERTRRVQEEVRRKILERMQGAPHASMPRPAQQPVARSHQAPPPLPSIARAPRSVEDESANAYRVATEKLAELQARADTSSNEAFAVEKTAANAPSMAGDLNTILRDNNSLRRAFLLREILDKPVGLR